MQRQRTGPFTAEATAVVQFRLSRIAWWDEYGELIVRCRTVYARYDGTLDGDTVRADRPR